MTRKTLFRIGTIVFCALFFLSGCMSFNPKSLRTAENALLDSNPGLELDTNFKFGLGPLTIDFIDFALVHEKGLDVSKISRAEVAIYTVKNELIISDFNVPENAVNNRRCDINDVIVRVIEDTERVFISACVEREEVKSLSILVVEPSEIVVVNVRGDFDALISSFLKANSRDELLAMNDRDPEKAEQL